VLRDKIYRKGSGFMERKLKVYRYICNQSFDAGRCAGKNGRYKKDYGKTRSV